MLKKCAITVQVKQVEKMFKNFLYNAWLDVKKKKIIRGFINNYINVTHRYRSRTVVCKHLNTKKKEENIYHSYATNSTGTGNWFNRY